MSYTEGVPSFGDFPMNITRIRPVLCGLAALSLVVGFGRPAHADNSFVPSTEASKNAHVVNKGVKWYTSLEEAQSEAKRSGKLVLWIHMLGTMEGAT